MAIETKTRPAFRPGDILVGTQGKILRVDPATGDATLITTSGAFGNATGIDLEPTGDLAVATDGGEVVRVSPHTGTQLIIHSSGRLYHDIAVKPDNDYLVVNLPSATTSALFNIDHVTGKETKVNAGASLGDGPTGIVIGKDGHFYIAGSDTIIRVHKTTGAETTVAQAGHLLFPHAIALFGNGHLCVADHGSDKVIDIDTATGVQTVISAGGHLSGSVGTAIEPSGMILVATLKGDKLVRIDPATGSQSVLAEGASVAPIRSVAVVSGG